MPLKSLVREITELSDYQVYGRVSGVLGMLVELSGLDRLLVIGSRCILIARDERKVPCEVIGFRQGHALLLPFGSLDGIGLGCKAVLAASEPSIHPSDAWLGRVVNALGDPIDGKGPLPMGPDPYKVRQSPPPAHGRQRVGGKIDLGVRAINTFLSCCQGQRMGIFAGSGVGKSVLLSLKAPLPAGTQLNLMFLPMPEEQALSSGDRALPGNYQTLPGSGQDLRSALQSSLSALIQQGQGNLLAKHIPHQGSALTSGILLFLNAIKAGGNRPWVGQEAISLLRSSGNTDLAQQLTNDNPALNRPFETPQGDWRMTQLPILHEGTLQKANLFVRDRENGPHKGGKLDREEETRFKLEVEMSRDGDMQFDGLVKKNKFDLVIRSRNELPNQMQSRISEMFYGANEATGFSGRLTFEASQEWEKLTDIANKLIAGTHNSTLA